MPRSRRAKSRSVDSGDPDLQVNIPSLPASAINGILAADGPMAPPAASTTSSLTRRKVSSSGGGKAPTSTSPATRTRGRNGGVGRGPAAAAAVVASTVADAELVGGGKASVLRPASPSATKFLVVVLSSLVLEVALQSTASLVGGGELAGISRVPGDSSWPEAVGLLGWKAFVLGVYWFGGFDAVDVVSLTLLLQTPTSVLYHFFYLIHPLTIGLYVVSTTLAQSLPFYLMRPMSPAHDGQRSPAALMRNRPIVSDPVTTAATSVLATVVFATVLQASFSTFLPSWLVTRFAGLRSLDFAYQVSTTLPTLVLWLSPAGLASTQFLFRPAEAATELTASEYAFDPATSGLGQHIYHNAWGWYTTRQKELIGRTVILGLLVLAETTVHLWSQVKGVEPLGALGYASIWAGAVAVIGVVLDWVGGPSD